MTTFQSDSDFVLDFQPFHFHDAWPEDAVFEVHVDVQDADDSVGLPEDFHLTFYANDVDITHQVSARDYRIALSDAKDAVRNAGTFGVDDVSFADY